VPRLQKSGAMIVNNPEGHVGVSVSGVRQSLAWRSPATKPH
jgi:hypothetical protein